MTKIEYIVCDELKKLNDAYKKIYGEPFNNRSNFYGMWRKAHEKAERYGGLLVAIYEIIHAPKEDDVDYYDVIHQLIDDWYESEITK